MTAPANYEISEFSATLLLELKIISNHHTERERSDLFLFFLYLSPLPPILQCCQLFSLERRVPCPSQLAESAVMTGWQTASRRTQKEKCHFINPAWPCHQAATSPTSALPQQPSKRVIPLRTLFHFCLYILTVDGPSRRRVIVRRERGREIQSVMIPAHGSL